MADKERRDLSTRPRVGDIVEVLWKDHFTFQGNKPPTQAILARSWGQLVYECSDGVAVAQTEVVSQDPDHAVVNIHLGQFF